MAKFTLVCDHSCDLDTHVVTHQFDAENIYDVIAQFEFFLKGAGYFPPGTLDFACEEAEIEHSNQYFDKDRNR